LWPPNSLRAVDVSTLEANPFHGTRQASREATLGEFGINLDQDILRAVTGRPGDEQLGRRMTGIDSLSVRVRVNLSTLTSLLKRYLRKSEDDGYRTNFRWVDHVAEVRDDDLEGRLATAVIDLVNSNRPSVWAAIPERIDWANFDSFRFGGKKNAASSDDITLDRMMGYFDGAPASLNALLNTCVYCYAEDNPQPLHHWSFFKCLTADLDFEGEKYLLNAGKWYRVSREFVQEVDEELASLLEVTSTSTMPIWGDEHEDAYNARVSRDSSGRLALMDQVMIKHAGMPSPIEFCDLFSDDRKLIHVKRYGQSSVLSHLFMQGLVSAESLLSDAQFRSAVNEKLPGTHQLDDPNARPLPSQYEVVFAIESTELGVLKLPFFSRVTLRNVPLPSEADRKQFLSVLREAAESEGMHVDVESTQDLARETKISPAFAKMMNAAVWRGANDDEAIASAMDQPDHLGLVWIMFSTGKAPQLTTRFRERAMRQIMLRWPDTLALPIMPTGAIPLHRDLNWTPNGYVVSPTEAHKYELKGGEKTTVMNGNQKGLR
jgi:uncharacterized protein (TIGR04141 family)